MSFRSSASSSSSSSSQDTMRHVASNLPTDSQVLATATARVYHRPFNARSENWTYHGLRGTMVFGRSRSVFSAEKKSGSIDSLEETLWFRLIDPMKGLVWLHQVPNAFDYSLDKPFFHQFSGKVRSRRYLSFLYSILTTITEQDVWLRLRRRLRISDVPETGDVQRQYQGCAIIYSDHYCS